MIGRWTWMLGQVMEDGAGKTDAARPGGMKFSDLQNGFRQWASGATDERYRNGLLLVMGTIGVVVLAIYLRQRARQKKSVDSERRLGLELGRVVPFPWGTRMLLYWVARRSGTPFVTLLISAERFRKAVKEWAGEPTFAMFRRWGAGRLGRLEGVLFGG